MKKGNQDFWMLIAQLRMRFPMTPLTSRDLPRQQQVEQTPDVRVAHFATPSVPMSNTGRMDEEVGYDAVSMEMIGSDEDDVRPTQMRAEDKRGRRKRTSDPIRLMVLR